MADIPITPKNTKNFVFEGKTLYTDILDIYLDLVNRANDPNRSQKIEIILSENMGAVAAFARKNLTPELLASVSEEIKADISENIALLERGSSGLKKGKYSEEEYITILNFVEPDLLALKSAELKASHDINALKPRNYSHLTSDKSIGNLLEYYTTLDRDAAAFAFVARADNQYNYPANVSQEFKNNVRGESIYKCHNTIVFYTTTSSYLIETISELKAPVLSQGKTTAAIDPQLIRQFQGALTIPKTEPVEQPTTTNNVARIDVHPDLVGSLQQATTASTTPLHGQQKQEEPGKVAALATAGTR